MPITHAELIYNTGNFVRDYPFVMDRTEQNAHGAAPGAPAANGYGQVAIHGILANIYIHYPTVWRWFTVDAAPAPYQWGAFHNCNIKAEMTAALANPIVPGGASNGRAYFLPWRTNTITSIGLGNNANFFFTAPLSGCKVYIDRVGGGAPTVYHANAGGIPANNKERYMDMSFQAASGHLITNHNVKTFNTRMNIMALTTESTLPIAAGMANRKSGRNLVHGRRRDVKWRITGGNLMGRRTAIHTWNFYWQLVGVMEYKRPKIDFNLKKRLKSNWGNTIIKSDIVEVVETGQL